MVFSGFASTLPTASKEYMDFPGFASTLPTASKVLLRPLTAIWAPGPRQYGHVIDQQAVLNM